MKTDTFSIIFLNQPVIITTNVMVTSNFHNEHASEVHSTPMEYKGILLEKDENYYYLGDEAGQILMSIRDDNKILSIQLSDGEESEVLKQVLEQMPTPTNDTEMN